MNPKSRTEYSARNTMVAAISRLFAIFMGYLTRVVFTHTLSENYVGVNGLFTDILNILSLTELGIGTAITYALYRPIVTGDKEKQKSLMRLYGMFYRLTAVLVTVLGLAVIPFFGILIKNPPQVGHLTFIYLLYLANTVLSYLFVYKRALMDANQLTYMGTLYQTVFLLLQDVMQIVILVTTRNFYLFLLVLLLCTLGANLCISRKADRLYPFLREKQVQPLAQQDKKEISRNVRAMLMHKLGNVAVNNTDNLILSSFVGIVSVGIYSNYYLLIGSMRQVLDQIFQGITASVGNLGITARKEQVKRIFEAAFFIDQWMYGAAAICLYECLDPFVELSFGKQYVFPTDIVLILCLNFFITGLRRATLVFRDSLGLFWFDRYKSIAEAVINLGASICLVIPFGVFGVFLGTIISTLLTSTWVEPYVLYKHRLECSVLPYFLHYFLYCGVMSGVWLVTDLLCKQLSGNIWIILIGRIFISLSVPNLLLLLVYHRKWEFRFLCEKTMTLIHIKERVSKE
jgi:O-antigen/teichoic acid export membrane protein